MTPRSQKYFKRKKAFKILERLLPAAFAYVDALIKASQPIPRYPNGATPGDRAIVGELGPELVVMKDGTALMPGSRIFPIIEHVDNFLNARDFAERLRNRPRCAIIFQGIMEFKIANFGTPEAAFMPPSP